MRDLNGNGSIDSGAELFGDETLLANGQKAAHGFAALSDLDTGSVVNGVTVGAGDGVFDAKDAQYANLRIWRDLNQDGISQSGELKTLTETGVQGIKLGSTGTNTNYGDAILAQSSDYTRVDGSTGQAGSFILAQNNFMRSFTPITVSDAAKALPGIQGSGWVRDLREAATLSPELITLFNQAKDTPTRAGYKDAVAALLREWGNDSGYNSASKQALAAGYGLILSDPLDDQERGWMDKAIKAGEAERDTYRATLSEADRAKFDAMRERMVGGLEKTYAYEAFTGHTFLNWNQVLGDALGYTARSAPAGRVPVEVWVPLSQLLFENQNGSMSSQPGYIRVTIPTPPSGMPHIETLWNRLVDDATTNLMPTLRLSKYLGMVDLVSFDATSVHADFSRLNAGLAAASSANTYEGTALFLDIYHSYGAMLDGMGWNGMEQLRTLMQRAVAETDVRNAFNVTGFSFFASGSTTGTVGNDAFAGDANANLFSAGAGDDLIDGQAGNDNLSGGAGDDVVFGGTGADTVFGGDGDDAVNGGADNDTVYGDAGADTLDGGAGNDTLSGGAGNDTYLFGKGSGQDAVNNYDTGTGKIDTIRFAAGVAVSEVLISRSSDDLVLSIAGTTDKLTVQSYFNADAAGSYKVEQIQFADGTSWNVDTVKALSITGNDTAQTLRGYATADTINAAGGNDTVYGMAGNDTLDGGTGADTVFGGDGDDAVNGGADNDTVYGDAGADTLDGGAGNDTLSGGAGNDTYLFGKGDGQDSISADYDTAATKFNVLRFKSGVAPSEVVATRSGGDLVLTIAGTTDKVTIGYFFYSVLKGSASHIFLRNSHASSPTD